MQQPESAYAVHSPAGDVLQEAPEKLVRGQRHALALLVSAVAVREGDRVVVAVDDRLVGQSGAVYVSTEVVQDVVRLRDGLGADDPALVVDGWQTEAGYGAASEVEKAPTEGLRQRMDVHEEGLRSPWRVEPGDAVGSECPRGDEQVDVWMPLESARPGADDGESAEAATDEARVGAQCGERIEGSAEERADKRALVLAHGASQLCGQGEDDVEVRDGQKQVALSVEPAGGGTVSAAGAGSVVQE